MKSFLSLSSVFFVVTLFFTSCNNGRTEELQSKIDSLQTIIKNTYKPGLGEFMLQVQTHHEKLWFAGINENWPLAEFEIGEMKETLYGAIHFLPERKETKDIPIIFPALDSLQASVTNKDLKMFITNYKTLTQTCNTCHQIAHFEFNFIKIPTSEPVSDQEFRAKN
jgi:hypothetical protein